MKSQVTFAEEHAYGKETTESGIIINRDSSVGINAILNKLASESVRPTRVMYDVYAINILTVTRNSYKVGMSDSMWLDAADKDINAFKTYITAYSHGCSNKPLIIFYLPTYIILPGHARKVSPMNMKITAIADLIEKMLPKRFLDISTAEMQMRYICLEKTPLPNRQITQYIQKLSNTGSKAAVLMFSHCPLDLHVHKFIPNLTIIESYTAELKVPSDFGKKVFKHEGVPFNKYTHLTFGDSVHIAGLIRKKKHKDVMFQRALDNNWRVLTEREILQQLIMYGIPEGLLTKLKIY